MIKKLGALAATALFSMNASASYIQYNFDSPGLSGFFVQNEQDRSIAYGLFSVVYKDGGIIEFGNSHSYAMVDWAKTRYNNQGPTRFQFSANDTEGLSTSIWLDFSATNDPDVFRFTSRYMMKQVWSPVPEYHLTPVVLYPRGTVTRGTVNPDLAANLDWYLNESGGTEYDYEFPRIVPKLHVIPEPASLALFALGVAGLAGAARRRKSLT